MRAWSSAILTIAYLFGIPVIIVWSAIARQSWFDLVLFAPWFCCGVMLLLYKPTTDEDLARETEVIASAHSDAAPMASAVAEYMRMVSLLDVDPNLGMLERRLRESGAIE